MGYSESTVGSAGRALPRSASKLASSSFSSSSVSSSRRTSPVRAPFTPRRAGPQWCEQTSEKTPHGTVPPAGETACFLPVDGFWNDHATARRLPPLRTAFPGILERTARQSRHFPTSPPQASAMSHDRSKVRTPTIKVVVHVDGGNPGAAGSRFELAEMGRHGERSGECLAPFRERKVIDRVDDEQHRGSMTGSVAMEILRLDGMLMAKARSWADGACLRGAPSNDSAPLPMDKMTSWREASKAVEPLTRSLLRSG